MSTIGIALHPLATLLVTDSVQPHEQVPHGVPSNYSWCFGPVTQDPTNKNGYPYMNPWGQVYAAATGNPHPGALVEIRDMQCYVADAAGGWTALYPGPPQLGGAAFPENFQGSSVGGNIDTSTPGSIIVSPVPGRLFHTYPNVARAQLPNPAPNALHGIVVIARARLVQDATPCPGLIFNVGADFWQAPDTGVVSGVGQGRFKTVKRDWRAFTYTTLTAAQIAAEREAGTLPAISIDPGDLY